LFGAGTLNGFDLTFTVFNFMLPSGTILNTNEAPTSGTITTRIQSARPKKQAAQPVPAAAPVEEEEDSTQGLGGYQARIRNRCRSESAADIELIPKKTSSRSVKFSTRTLRKISQDSSGETQVT
jgi:hypothetical protein